MCCWEIGFKMSGLVWTLDLKSYNIRIKPNSASKRIKHMNPPEEYIHHNAVEPGQGGSNPENNKLLFSTNGIGESNSLEKVRDILFGNQIREVDKRFARIEERLMNELVNVRDETRKRLDALESYIRQEVDSLTERLKKEQLERDAAVRSLSEEQRNVNLSLENKIAQLDEQTTNRQRELREQLLNQSKNLQDDLQQKYEEILTVLKRETQELQKDKTDRSKLAALFTELAIRLNADNKS
jgi:DNA repair exonuclease SbcCD ATPase subunit